MTTKSPVSMCGAKVGLCLPRRRMAAWEASRPSTTSVASITCQARVISPGLGLYVGTDLPRRSGLVLPVRCAVRPGVRCGRAVRATRAWPRVATAAHRISRVPAAGGGLQITPLAGTPCQRARPHAPPSRPPQRGVGALRGAVTVLGATQRPPDVGQHVGEVGGRVVPLALPGAVLVGGLALPRRRERR